MIATYRHGLRKFELRPAGLQACLSRHQSCELRAVAEYQKVGVSNWHYLSATLRSVQTTVIQGFTRKSHQSTPAPVIQIRQSSLETESLVPALLTASFPGQQLCFATKKSYLYGKGSTA